MKTDVMIKGTPHPVDCLKWQGPYLVLTSPKSISILETSSQPALTKPNEILPESAELEDIEFACTTEDMISLAEFSEARVVDAVPSCYGLSRYKLPFLAVLTADHRISVYGPSGDPTYDRWRTVHALLSKSLARANLQTSAEIDCAETIKQLRFTSTAWTLPYFHETSRWGDQYLLSGNEAGELQFHLVDCESQDLIQSIKCSDDAIVAIKSTDWTIDGVISVVVADVHGTIKLVRYRKSLDKSSSHFNLVDFRTLIPATVALCTNIEVTELIDSALVVAAAFPGTLKIATLTWSSDKSSVYEYPLPYSAATSGLCWQYLHGNDVRLYAFGQTGQHIVLRLNTKSLEVYEDQEMMSSLTRWQKDQIAARPTVSEEFSDVLQMRYYGASLSTDSIFLAISYSIEVINKVKYLIPATTTSNISLHKVSEDVQTVLERIISEFLVNTYRLSCQDVIGVYKGANHQILEFLDKYNAERGAVQGAFSGNDLAKRLYRNTTLNSHKLAMASAELKHDISKGLARELQQSLMIEILRWAKSVDLSLGRWSVKTLLRYTDYIAIHRRSEEPLSDLAMQIYTFLQDGDHDYVKEIQSLTMQDKEEDVSIPCRESCPACAAPVPISDSMSSGVCLQGHIWPRCSITMELLSDLRARSCLECGRKAVSIDQDIMDKDPLYRNLIDACDHCYFCTGKWYHKV